MKIRFAITLLALVGSQITSAEADAKETRYKDYPLEIKEGDRLAVSVLKGSVRLIPAAPGKPAVLRARKTVAEKASADDLAKYEAMSFAIRRDGNTFTIETKGPDQKAAWSQWMKPGAPDLALEIESPMVPAEIQLRDGQVIAQNWKQSLLASVVNGAVRTSGTEGNLRIGIQKGEVRIEKHRGRTEVDSYGAKLHATELEGDLDLSNFGGESQLSQVRGNIDVRSHGGLVKVEKSEGSVDFVSGRGAVQLVAFEGPVRGQSEHGPVTADVDGEAEVNIESNQGAVTVKLPSDSGASIRLQTEEGTVSVPDVVRAPASGPSKIVTARLSGQGPKGTVAVKTKAAAIRLRQ